MTSELRKGEEKTVFTSHFIQCTVSTESRPFRYQSIPFLSIFCLFGPFEHVQLFQVFGDFIFLTIYRWPPLDDDLSVAPETLFWQLDPLTFFPLALANEIGQILSPRLCSAHSHLSGVGLQSTVCTATKINREVHEIII